MRPIWARFAVSRSPAEPKTAISPPPRAAAPGARRSRTVWSEAGLWAKSTMTPNGWPWSMRSIRPGTRSTLARPAADGSRVQPEGLAQGDDGEGVVDVEAADEPEVDRGVTGGARDLGVEARGVLGDPGGPDVGGGLGAVGDDLRPRLAGHADEHPGRRIVDVDDPGGRRSVEPGEQRQLGVAVRLPRAVQLEVLVGQVGEDGDVVVDRGDAVQGKAVGRRLEHHRVIAGIDHRPQRGLQLRRLRGRGMGVVVLGPSADARRDRADHPGPPAGRFERGHREVRGRRLAVRPRDADDGEGPRRVSEPPGGRAGQDRAGGVDHDLRGGQPGEWPLHDDRGGTALEGVRDVVVPVDVLPGDGDEQHPGRHRTRVVGHATERDRARRRGRCRAAVEAHASQAPIVAEAGEQLAQWPFHRHRLQGWPPARVGAHRPSVRAARVVRRPRL